MSDTPQPPRRGTRARVAKQRSQVDESDEEDSDDVTEEVLTRLFLNLELQPSEKLVPFPDLFYRL